MTFKVQFATYIAELWTLCTLYGLKSLKRAIFDEVVRFYSRTLGRKVLGDCYPILGHASGHWDALI